MVKEPEDNEALPSERVDALNSVVERRDNPFKDPLDKVAKLSVRVEDNTETSPVREPEVNDAVPSS